MKYFHNDLSRVHDTEFMSVPAIHVFEDRVLSWELPSSCCAIIRATSPKGKVKEFIYKRPSHARRKIEQLLEKDYEVVTCSHTSIAEFY